MNPYFILFLLLGLSCGSFINVVIYRYPRKISLIKLNSFCPKCKASIPLYRNIPLISFILQFGKCAQCKKSISFRYPLVEALIASLWCWGYIAYPNYENIFFILVVSILIIIAFIDMDTMQIPMPLIGLTSICIIGYNFIFSEDIVFIFHGLLAGIGYLSFVLLFTWIIFRKQTLGIINT